MSSDWMFNGDISSGRVKCHGRGDLVRGKNMDWARVDGDKATLQKLILYFAIPPGEIVNDPGVGCCLHNELFNKTTKANLALLRVKLDAELKRQLPELGVQYIEIKKLDNNSISLKIVGYATWLLQVSRDDLMDISLLDVFSGGSS